MDDDYKYNWDETVKTANVSKRAQHYQFAWNAISLFAN
jgi:hypothetical protein